MVQDNFAPAVASHPAIDKVIPFPRQRLASWWKNPARFVEMVRWFYALRRHRYDLVIDAQGLGRSGLMTLITGAKVRVGLRNAREFAWIGYNRKVPVVRRAAPPVHTVDQMMALVEALGIDSGGERDMRLYVPEGARQWWSDKRRELQMVADGSADHAGYAVIAPTARWPSKRWPIDRFAQLIEPLAMRGFSRVIVIGAPGEEEQVRELFTRSSPFVINYIGKATIAQTMAIIADAGLVIANDSAPLHMAVGFDRPCIGLFGPTDPAFVGPYQREDSVIRGYNAAGRPHINFKDATLGDSLMRFISTTAVIQKIDAVLASRADAAKRIGAASRGVPASGTSSQSAGLAS